MAKKLYSQAVSSDSEADLSQEAATTGHCSSWLVKFQREDEETALKKAIKLRKVSNDIRSFSYMSFIGVYIVCSDQRNPEVAVLSACRSASPKMKKLRLLRGVNAPSLSLGRMKNFALESLCYP